MGAKPCKLCCGCVRGSKENIPASISGTLYRNPTREPFSRRALGYGSDRRKDGTNVQYSKIPTGDSEEFDVQEETSRAPTVESEDFDLEDDPFTNVPHARCEDFDLGEDKVG